MAKITIVMRIVLSNGTIQKCYMVVKIWQFCYARGNKSNNGNKGFLWAMIYSTSSLFLYKWWWRAGLKFKNSPIFLLFHHDLEEVVAARQSAGHRYTKPVGWCSDRANLSLWLVEITETKQSLDYKSLWKNVTLTSEKNKV